MQELSIKSKRIIKGLKARMEKIIDLNITACGHEVLIERACDYEDKTFRWLKEMLAELEAWK